MAVYTPEGFGKRIRAELQNQKRTIQWLQTEVEKGTGGATGSSWGSIYSYWRGKGPQDEPRPKIVKAIAEALGVLPNYLLYNGPRTNDDSPLRVPSPENREAMQRLRIAVYEAVRAELGPLMPVGVDVGIIEMVMTAVASVARSMQMTGDDYGTDESARYTESASLLGRAVVAPLRTLAIDPAQWTEPAKAQYVLQAIASLMVPLDTKYFGVVREWSLNREKAAKRKAKRKRAAKNRLPWPA